MPQPTSNIPQLEEPSISFMNQVVQINSLQNCVRLHCFAPFQFNFFVQERWFESCRKEKFTWRWEEKETKEKRRKVIRKKESSSQPISLFILNHFFFSLYVCTAIFQSNLRFFVFVFLIIKREHEIKVMIQCGMKWYIWHTVTVSVISG